MPSLTITQVREYMNDPDHIRNISIIAKIDHGRSTLTDCLISRAGIIITYSSNYYRYRDYREDSDDRGTVIHPATHPLYFEKKCNKTGIEVPCLINLMTHQNDEDSLLGANATFRNIDGIILAIDCVEGVCVQTEALLRHALTEKIRPIYIINKLDKAILDLNQDAESIYQAISRQIYMLNLTVSSYDDADMGDLKIHPEKGNVAFGSAKQSWGFTLDIFASMYSSKFNIPADKLISKLWGDKCYDSDTDAWITKEDDNKNIKRGFVQFILDPITRLAKSIMDGNDHQIDEMLSIIQIKLSAQEKELKGKLLLKEVLSKWINMADCVLNMTILHLPSPKAAQKYRTSYLYEGPQNDDCAQAIRECNPEGPLMIYISRMMPTTDRGRFYAIGRVFSGTVHSGQKVRIMGPNYQLSKKIDLSVKTLQAIRFLQGRFLQLIDSVPSGNIVGLVGIDRYLLKNGTISDHDEAYSIRGVKFSTTPTVKVTIEPKNPADLYGFVDSLRRYSRSEPLLSMNIEETGQYTLSCSSEAYLKKCLLKFRHEYSPCDIIQSDGCTIYKETISAPSSLCVARSANKHNRLFCTTQPLNEELCQLIEKREICSTDDFKLKSQSIVEQFEWDPEDTKKVWAFGPDDCSANLLVDLSKGVQHMSEIQDSCCAAFHWITKEGVLCEENMRMVRFNIHDAILHTDAIHRGGGQIIPTARRAYYACQLTSHPTLQEPISLVVITSIKDVLSTVYTCIEEIKGIIIDETAIVGTNIVQVRVHLPTSQEIGSLLFVYI